MWFTALSTLAMRSVLVRSDDRIPRYTYMLITRLNFRSISDFPLPCKTYDDGHELADPVKHILWGRVKSSNTIAAAVKRQTVAFTGGVDKWLAPCIKSQATIQLDVTTHHANSTHQYKGQPTVLNSLQHLVSQRNTSRLLKVYRSCVGTISLCNLTAISSSPMAETTVSIALLT